MGLKEDMEALALHAKDASRKLSGLPAEARNRALLAMADALPKRTDELLAANARDLDTGRSLGLSAAMLDRLALNDARIAAMAEGLRQAAALPDPLGRVLDERVRPNGLRLRKVAVPIGVIVIIYESRPNVTADAAGLCLESGNATILRGGREARHSNQLIAAIMVAAARAAVPEFPEHAIQVVPTPDREAIPALLSLVGLVALCIPRGGEGLIRAVAECSRVPVIKHYKGVCHVFVDRAADPAMAEEIVFNAKCQRPSTCNAAETLLVDWPVATELLPRVAARLWTKHVEIRADTPARTVLAMKSRPPEGKLVAAQPADWETEHNDYILNVKVVDGLADAVAHINRHGSGHSDAIVTADEAAARRFLAEVDSAAVYWNASTRFTDGFEYGMGAEIGISTDKIGARGPMGLDELCSYKWIGEGTGQVRS
ncbi:MAG TPA: glutamate-5-semialdehyde dehydrogenase [Verrucomicrobiota bacterium]|nr:glutamate-5-semialdehyde dehydrogenase [Verrucomicrobiota bacterium]